MDILSIFSERLSELMFDGKITTEQLGKAIGLNGSAVRHWKEKTNSIALSNAVAVADYFKCSLEYLFGRTENFLDFTPLPVFPFYDRLRSIMDMKNITRYRICLDLKKSHRHFDKWKSGADPLIETVIELADYFDCTLDYLVGRER